MTLFSRWNDFSWVKTKESPFGETIMPQRLPSLDYTERTEKSISTSVDVFVTGQYISHKGRTFSIRERYTVHVRYSMSNIREVMSRIREMIMSKFQQDNPDFNITDIFIPELIRPSAVPEPKYMYRGGRVWRYITRFSEGRFRLQTEKDIYKSRASRLIAKYGLKRREGQIRRL